MENINVIWIDKKIENNENKVYLQKLSKYNTYPFKDIDNAINKIKEIHFENTFIIIAGSIYKYFINAFINELKNIYVIPKIVIFTSTIENCKKYNKEVIEKLEDPFYCFGGIKTTFSEVNDFISKNINFKSDNSINKKKENYQYYNDNSFFFEYIDQLDKKKSF